MLHVEMTSSWFILVMVALLTIFLIYWSFRNIRNIYYPKTIKYILILLRICVMIIFIMILSDLNIEINKEKQLPSNIAVIWDLSESINLSDSSFNTSQILRSQTYKELSKQVNFTHIIGMAEPGVISAIQLKDKKSDEKHSDNSVLLRFAERQLKFNEIILISDGNSYLGEALESIRLSEEVTIHAIGIGSTQMNGLPQIRSIKSPEYIIEGDSIPVNWAVYNDSKDDIDTELFIKVRGKELYRKKLNISAGRMIPLKYTFPPHLQGSIEWEWYVEHNNEIVRIGSENLQIHPSTTNILCFADPPDQDIAMISTILKKDKRYKVYGLKDWQAQFPNSEPDLLIQTWHPETITKKYHDVPSILIYRDDQGTYLTGSNLKLDQMKPYVYFVSDPGENARNWTQLPPIQFADYESTGKYIMSSGNRPIIIEDPESKAIVINASGLWRWNLAGYGKDWDGIYKHLIRGMVKTLITQFGNTYVSLNEDIYTGIEYRALPIMLQWSDNTLPSDNENMLTLSLMDSAYNEIKRWDLVPYEEMVEFTPDEPGEYFLTMRLYSNGTLLESDTSLVKIDINDMESRYVGCNESALTKLTQHHNGHYVHLSELTEILSHIDTEKKWVQVNRVFIARKNYLIFALMFLMLCADWIIRKRSGGI